MSRVRVFIASSIDGFIAGPRDELDWLDGRDGAEDTFTPFLQTVGALLMGRRTFDVVRGFEGEWPYGDLPVLVATHRSMQTERATVRGVGGSIRHLVDCAKTVARGRDVYIDGGALIRSALDECLVDSIVVTLIPVILGAGLPLFAGCKGRTELELRTQRALGSGMVQLEYTPVQSNKRD
jgi:dihydrofolate reductase